MTGDRDAAAVQQELASPEVKPERLAEIAYHHPELRRAVAGHPNAYPELVGWIEQQAPPAQQPAPRPQPAPQPQPAEATEATEVTEATQRFASDSGRLSGAAKTKTLLTGLGIGVLFGGALSVVLLLWVLPGLFGSVL